MGLGIYSRPDPSAKASQGTFAAPLTVAADGRRGTSAQRRLYIRNDDPAFMFSGISVRPVDLTGPSVVDGTGGYGIKVLQQELQPTESGWALASQGQATTFSGIVLGSGGDISTYVPFWVRVQVPKNIAVRNITDVRLRLSSTRVLR